MYEWLLALLGGVLIGSSVSLLLVMNGKVLGVSGIVFNGFKFKLLKEASNHWRLYLLLGMLIPPAIYQWIVGRSLPEVSSNLWLAGLAGLLVSIGTRLGGGCTSGHGIAGIGRLSKRSILATITFMSSAVVTVFVMGALT